MPFESVLFDRPPESAPPPEPDFFGDLHLDQICASLSQGREEYDLVPLFRTPLHSVESVRYRHHVLGDLENADVMGTVKDFAHGMAQMRRYLSLADKLRYELQSQRWFLEATAAYCAVVSGFAEALGRCQLKSSGLTSLRDYVVTYRDSAAFTTLAEETQQRKDELATVEYAVHIRGNRVTVTEYDNEPDIGEEVQAAFAKFQQDAARDYRVRFPDYPDMNHVEAQILGLVRRLFPEPFAHLATHCQRHREYLDPTLARLDREVQLYLAYLEHIAPLKEAGLTFSYPRVSGRSKEIAATATFDLSLAAKLVHDHTTVVCNDFHLSGPERVLVVSGPNNGGKTTFARTFGQLHYLASLGLPVPGTSTRLFLPDQIFTHFEREEAIETLRGKFEDELYRIHEIFEHATSSSVLIMNESFGSTTLRDAVTVGTEVMRQIIALDALCVFVTFVDELASLGESTVSMMSTVVPEDPAVRTFKVVRKPADGLAYAAALADKYGLSTESLRRRITR